MKRITTLVLALAFALGGITMAKADGIDVKVKGQWDFAFGWADNTAFKNSVHGQARSRDDDKTVARQRIRTQINFIAGEHLQGVLMFEIGDIEWGRGGSVGRGSGGGLDSDGVNVETKRAFVDWIVPETEIMVRMGIQGLTLPNVMGSPVFDADVAGILVSTPIWWDLNLTAFWIRPFDAYGNDDEATKHDWVGSLDDEADIFGLLLPFHGDQWSVTPWGMYGLVGNASGVYSYLFGDRLFGDQFGPDYEAHRTSVWWAGLNFEFNYFDPISFKLDAMYGRMNRNDLRGVGANLDPLNYNPGYAGGLGNAVGTKGWFLAAALDFPFEWGTPGVFGWWSSGDDKDDVIDDGYFGRIPVLGVDQGFQPTTFGFPGSYSIGSDGVVSQTGAGTWGVGIQLADLSFIKDLSHTLRVAYYRGTNDSELVRTLGEAGNPGTVVGRYVADTFYLTTKDYVLEVNFDHEYKIYENLTAILELGYLHLNADGDTWAGINNGRSDETQNAWKAQVLFQYKF